MSTGQTVYPTENWLSFSNNDGTTGATLTVGSTNTLTGDWWTPTYPSYWYTYPTYSERRIRLKLSEVERLREVARKDEGVREILQKFSPHIEIEVDF